MCGIFAILNSNKEWTDDTIYRSFQKGKPRGPESSNTVTIRDSHDSSEVLLLGFHRLAINGLNNQSNQPLTKHGITLICNGEIYNHRALYEMLKDERPASSPSISFSPTTQSDCEVIIDMYIAHGIEYTLSALDGVFAFVLCDMNREEVYVARDPFGVRPLYEACREAFASELKCLVELYDTVTPFNPGTYSKYACTSSRMHLREIISHKSYFIPNPMNTYVESFYFDHIRMNIYNLLSDAVAKRCANTERPVACLLSGGLDSSLVAALVARRFSYPIETYCIGLEGSEDMVFANMVAKHIGSKHTSIVVTEQEMFDAIPEVIYAIESYDTTTVRASIGNYLVGKFIAAHSEAKVIFNGDGSDELFGGYLYMNHCPSDLQFDVETRRLLADIHLFDVLRSDKSISSNGLEPRTPFLDKALVNFVLSLSPVIRNHANRTHMDKKTYGEKWLLRSSFDMEPCLIPREILMRKKEAFSDGVSTMQRSLFTILQEKISGDNEPSIEMEKKYYKGLFDGFFKESNSHVVPYYWMPKFVRSNDPSARTLHVYGNSHN